MKAHLITSFFFTMALVALTGCGSSIKYTTIEPKPADIVGIYHFTDETSSEVLKANYVQTNTPSLTFYANGKFEMLNMPGCRLEEPIRPVYGQPTVRSFDSGSGTWRIVDNGVKGYPPSWGILLKFSDSKTVNSWHNRTPIVFGGLMLRNEKPPYLLHIIVGDPDEDEGLEFSKIEESTK